MLHVALCQGSKQQLGVGQKLVVFDLHDVKKNSEDRENRRLVCFVNLTQILTGAQTSFISCISHRRDVVIAS